MMTMKNKAIRITKDLLFYIATLASVILIMRAHLKIHCLYRRVVMPLCKNFSFAGLNKPFNFRNP